MQFLLPPWYKGGGGGWMEPFPRSFQYVVVFRNGFTLSGKTLMVIALPEACDVTNNSHHVGFYQELEIRLQSPEMVIFCSLQGK